MKKILLISTFLFSLSFISYAQTITHDDDVQINGKLDVTGDINSGNGILKVNNEPFLIYREISSAYKGNILLGNYAGHLLDSGFYNTFIGHYTGYFNKTGQYNTFIGREAGKSSTGNYNTYIGANAGVNVTTGNNLFIGYMAGGEGSGSGHSNTFIGASAGRKNTNGTENLFIGQGAGVANTIGGHNMFLGRSTGANNISGHNNMFLGELSGFDNTIGSNNVFIGNSAGKLNTSGSGNVYIGKDAGSEFDSLSSDKMAIAGVLFGDLTDGDEKIGVGVTAPEAKLHVGNATNDWTTNGWGKGLLLDAHDALSFKTSENQYYAFGAKDQNRFFIGQTASNDNTGSMNYIMTIKDSNVGIGTSTPSEKLDISGNANIAGSSPYITLDNTDYSANKWRLMANIGGVHAGGFAFNEVVSGANNYRMVIKPGGNVEIGTNGNYTNPNNYKLAVKGQIGAIKLKLEETTWADYVFEDTYKLRSLKEVENFIKENKHLPGIPSAKEIEKEGGVDVGSMNVKFLEKIEELTLYSIELKNENISLKNELKEKEADIKSMQKKLEAIDLILERLNKLENK